MKVFHIAVAGALALTGLASANAATIVNGGFEGGTTPSGEPAGWTAPLGPDDTRDLLVLQAAAYQPCCGVTGTPAQLANHFLSFGAGQRANDAQLEQSFATIANRAYTLVFDFGALAGGTGRTQTLFASVFDGAGTLLTSGSFVANSTNDLGALFTTHSLTFTGLSSSARVVFGVDSTTDSVDGALDNVRISAVPEPATWGMMIMGLGLAGGVLRRRRAVARAAFVH